MTLALTPRWAPLRFSTLPGTPLFTPTIVHERGLMIAGGPNAIGVFTIGDRQYEWFSIQKKSWITGFTVSASSLYVQDGPVLLGYDLTTGRPFAAINLVTGNRWPDPDDDDPATAPPDSLYSLEPADAALHARVLHARQNLAAAPHSLRADEHSTAAKVLAAAENDAQALLFSPPVARVHAVEGRLGGQVFSLRMDGKVYAIDSGLEERETFSAEVPLLAELTLAEVPQAAGNYKCNLFYMTATGAIKAIDATGDLTLLPGWPTRGAPDRARVLPLRFQGGHLMGGGILGADFFVRPLDASMPAVIEVAGPSVGWRQYDVAPAEKLVLLSDGTKSRLVSYDPSARKRDRWGVRESRAQSHALFWTSTGADAPLPSPKLTLEIDVQAANDTSDAGVRVVLANTVDAVNPAATPNYPPPSLTLDEGAFGKGSFAVLPRIAWFACRPVVAQHTIYAVVRSTLPTATTGTYAVAAFSLTGRMAEHFQKAGAELERLRRSVQVFEVEVSRIDHMHRAVSPMPGPKDHTYGPFPVANTVIKFVLDPGGERAVGTDARGVAYIDGETAGATVTARLPQLMLNERGSCSSTTLVAGTRQAIRFTIHQDN